MTTSVQGRVLVEGSAEGQVLTLEKTLSFWGGFDPAQGEIIDVHHPQVGNRVHNKILVIPASHGSAGTPACIAESLRNSSGPLAFVLGVADVNICVGVSVANRLYGMSIPVIEISTDDLLLFLNVDNAVVQRDGAIQID